MGKYYPERKPNQRWRCTPVPGATHFIAFDFTLKDLNVDQWHIVKLTNLHSYVGEYLWTTDPKNVQFIMILLCANAHE